MRSPPGSTLLLLRMVLGAAPAEAGPVNLTYTELGLAFGGAAAGSESRAVAYPASVAGARTTAPKRP